MTKKLAINSGFIMINRMRKLASKEAAFLDSPGTTFKDGRLFLVKPDKCVIMDPWPRPMAFKKPLRQKTWRPFRPLGGLFHLDQYRKCYATLLEGEDEHRFPDEPYDHDSALAYRLFYERIPHSVRQAIAPFNWGQWELLALIAACPGALDLIESNPALAFALASNWRFRKPAVKKPLKAARRLVLRRQREILGWLGFPESEAAVRVFRKISPSWVTVDLLLKLQRRMHSHEVMKKLAHLSAINPHIAYIIEEPWLFPFFSFRFLEEIAQGNVDFLRLESVLTLRGAREVGILFMPDGWKPVISSMKRLCEVHNELIEKLPTLEKLDIASFGDYKFPQPPLPGTPYIIPITGPHELHEEGKLQHNCVASYARRVTEGTAYVYRVLAPERATLALALSGKTWTVEGIRGESNEDAGPETVERVKEWLGGAKLRIEVLYRRQENS